MKRTVLALCIFIALVTAVDATCYKCLNDRGFVSFTDDPPPDAKCEWLAKCSSTYSEELQRAIEAKDAISSSQFMEAEARKSELKQRELDAKKLELKQRESDAKADQVQIEYFTEIYNTEIYNNVGKHPYGNENHKKRELDAKPRKGFTEKNNIDIQPATKIINKKSTAKVQQITPQSTIPFQKQ